MASKYFNFDLKVLNDTFRKWISREGQKHLSILITGKTGVGKSRLVNALVGRRVAIEGEKKTVCTTSVNSYSVVINGIEVRVWDSPGLQDGTCNEELYLEDMRKKLDKGPDIMIYCIKMDDKRFHKGDKDAIRALTRKFGKELWENAVIALTFANRVEDPDGGDKVAYFLHDLKFWRDEIDQFLARELGLDSTIRMAIPLVPVGISRIPHLPNCENWLSELSIGCYQRMPDSSRINLYRINKNRFKFPGSANIEAACSSTEMQTATTSVSDTRADTSQSADDQNIPEAILLNKEQQDTFWKSTWEAFKYYCVNVLGMGAIVTLGFGTILMLVGLKK